MTINYSRFHLYATGQWAVLFLTLKGITKEQWLLLHLGGCSSPMMLQVPSNSQCLELPVTDTEVCVLGGRLPFETCILWSHTQNYCALYCEAYRRLTVPNRKRLPHPFSILSQNNILWCDWVLEKHFNIYPTWYFRQFLFFSWGAHTDNRKLRLSPIFQVKKWEACKQ